MATASLPASTSSVSPLAAALVRTVSAAAVSGARRSIGSAWRRSLPEVIRLTSRMSSISRLCSAALRPITSSPSRTVAGSAAASPSISCVQPTIAFSGVRSSWLIVARKSSFIRLACSATLRSCRSLARAASRSSSARLRSVTLENRIATRRSSGWPTRKAKTSNQRASSDAAWWVNRSGRPVVATRP